MNIYFIHSRIFKYSWMIQDMEEKKEGEKVEEGMMDTNDTFIKGTVTIPNEPKESEGTISNDGE